MAHTDKTKPLRVRLWHGALVRIEEHDHRTGVCDLPATLGELLAQPADTRTSCTWEVLLTGVGVCPCGSCTGAHWHRADNRRERQRTKGSLRNQIKAWNATGETDE